MFNPNLRTHKRRSSQELIKTTINTNNHLAQSEFEIIHRDTMESDLKKYKSFFGLLDKRSIHIASLDLKKDPTDSTMNIIDSNGNSIYFEPITKNTILYKDCFKSDTN